jgi:hypothetical protein
MQRPMRFPVQSLQRLGACKVYSIVARWIRIAKYHELHDRETTCPGPSDKALHQTCERAVSIKTPLDVEGQVRAADRFQKVLRSWIAELPLHPDLHHPASTEKSITHLGHITHLTHLTRSNHVFLSRPAQGLRHSESAPRQPHASVGLCGNSHS